MIGASAAEAATYTYTGSEQTFAVPANVTGVDVVAVGAQGATFSDDIVTEAGGAGGELTAPEVPLPAGTSTLYVEVGGVGTAGAGGWNGGGGGPLGGGGASDIRTVSCSTSCATGGSAASLNSRLAVAGGGGGASDDAVGGFSENRGGESCDLCGGGGRLTEAGTAQSATEVTSYCKGEGDQNGEVGNDGELGLGGAGAYLFLTGTPESGGGGGGWYGGAGGAQCYDSGAVATAIAGSGGGGGSGTVAPSYSVLFADTTDPAEVIITAPVPTATTTPTVAGGLTVGDMLSETHAQWSTPMPLTGYTYQWERCDASGASCTAIAGATAQTYTLVTGDLGDTMRVQEIAENFYGTSATPSTSAASGVIGEPPSATSVTTSSAPLTSPPIEKGEPVVNAETGEITLEYEFPEDGEAQLEGQVLQGASLARTRTPALLDDPGDPLAGFEAKHRSSQKCKRGYVRRGKKCLNNAPVRYGRTTPAIATAGTYTLHLEPGTKVLAALKKGKTLSVGLTLVFTPAATTDHITETTAATVHLKLKKKHHSKGKR